MSVISLDVDERILVPTALLVPTASRSSIVMHHGEGEHPIAAPGVALSDMYKARWQGEKSSNTRSRPIATMVRAEEDDESEENHLCIKIFDEQELCGEASFSGYWVPNSGLRDRVGPLTRAPLVWTARRRSVFFQA